VIDEKVWQRLNDKHQRPTGLKSQVPRTKSGGMCYKSWLRLA
jgi:hypothetical protein